MPDRSASPPQSRRTDSRHCMRRTRLMAHDGCLPGCRRRQDPSRPCPLALPLGAGQSAYRTRRRHARATSPSKPCRYSRRWDRTGWSTPCALTRQRQWFPIHGTPTRHPPASRMRHHRLKGGSGRCWGCNRTPQPPSSSAPRRPCELSVSARGRSSR